MVHVGIDLHRDSCRVQALDDRTGELLVDKPLPAEKQALLDCLSPLRERGEMRLVMEACGFAGYWADVLDPLGEVAVVHPKHVAPYRRGKRKSDRRDTEVLVRLSTQNELPRAHIGTTAERDWKDLLRYRVGLVRIGTRLRVRLRNIAQRYGARLEASDVDSAKGRALWAQWELRANHRLMVDQLLQVLAEVEQRVTAVEEQIRERAKEAAPARTVEVLDSLPGVGWFGALLIAAEIGDWKRFLTAPALACFGGLVPSEDSSGDRIVRGRITKEGSSYLRWIMVQAALKHECSPRLHALFTRVAERRGRMKARVAVARELLVIAWHLLHKDELYEEKLPRASEPPTSSSVAGAERVKRSAPVKESKHARRSGQLAGPLTH
jgi:transposase